jgi:two-component system phosphate regulon sensor histidine kinase PhoR
MPRRFWPPFLIGLLLASLAALLSALGVAAWLVFLLVGLAGAVLALLAVAISPETPGARAAPVSREIGQDRPRGLDTVLLDHLPEPLILIEAGGRVVYLNRAARDRFPRLALNQHFAAVLRAPAFVDAVNLSIASGEPQVAEFTHFHGQESYFRAYASPGGTPSGGGASPILMLVKDLTADRRVERLRADFVANASHELRTPLAAIIGYIETLQGAARDDPAARDRFLGIMDRQAQRMKRLVDDLLSLNQIEMNEHVPPRGECDLVEVVREAAGALAPIAARRKAEIRLDLAGDPLPVRADRDQLVQVFVNLMDNAMKYGAPGTPIEIARRAPDARFPGMTGIGIADRGPGIAREHLPRLTERFYRISVQASRDAGGTGLGLAIVKHVLNRHRGELQIESWPGTGSRFSVWLPRLPAPVAEAAGAAEPTVT